MIKLKRSQCSILPLVLKGKWYDMIATGEKKEEYRANTQYWAKRLFNWMMNPPINGYLVVAFSRGYRKPDLFIRSGDYLRRRSSLRPDWGEPKGSHFVICLYNRVQIIDDKKGGAKLSDIFICNAEYSFKDIDPNPFSEVVSFDMVLRVRAVAARSDIPALEHMFQERAKALVESIKEGGAK